MDYIYSDGGRAACGFKGSAGDCAARAVAIATNTHYRDVYIALNDLATRERPGKGKRSSAREGVHMKTMRRLMEGLGWEWVPTMQIGSGCRVHMRADELPSGNLVVRLSRHYAAVIDGVLYDTHDCTRDGTRCVYGYWQKGQA